MKQLNGGENERMKHCSITCSNGTSDCFSECSPFLHCFILSFSSPLRTSEFKETSEFKWTSEFNGQVSSNEVEFTCSFELRVQRTSEFKWTLEQVSSNELCNKLVQRTSELWNKWVQRTSEFKGTSEFKWTKEQVSSNDVPLPSLVLPWTQWNKWVQSNKWVQGRTWENKGEQGRTKEQVSSKEQVNSEFKRTSEQGERVNESQKEENKLMNLKKGNKWMNKWMKENKWMNLKKGKWFSRRRTSEWISKNVNDFQVRTIEYMIIKREHVNEGDETQKVWMKRSEWRGWSSKGVNEA